MLILLYFIAYDKDLLNPNHVISGPMIESKTGSLRRNKQAGLLANAFKDAWKQGNLAAEVRRREGEGEERGRDRGKEGRELRK